MVELIEMYLHSREIQLKIEVATKPKQAVAPMFYTGATPPENPKQGDMYLDIGTSGGMGRSILRMYDGERFVEVSSAFEQPHTISGGEFFVPQNPSIPAGYPYERSYYQDGEIHPQIRRDIGRLDPSGIIIESHPTATATEVLRLRENIEREWRREDGIISASNARLIQMAPPYGHVELPEVSIRMNTPVASELIADAILSTANEPTRNRNIYTSPVYIGMDYSSDATVPLESRNRNDVTISSIPRTRDNDIINIGSRRNRSVSGTINFDSASINMDALRALLGGE